MQLTAGSGTDAAESPDARSQRDGRRQHEGTKPMDIADPFARRLMARYLGHRQQDLETLRAALERGDYDTVQRTGHNMHGSGSSYGLPQVSALGGELEDAAEERDGAAVARLIARLEAFLRAFHPA